MESIGHGTHRNKTLESWNDKMCIKILHIAYRRVVSYLLLYSIEFSAPEKINSSRFLEKSAFKELFSRWTMIPTCGSLDKVPVLAFPNPISGIHIFSLSLIETMFSKESFLKFWNSNLWSLQVSFIFIIKLFKVFYVRIRKLMKCEYKLPYFLVHNINFINACDCKLKVNRYTANYSWWRIFVIIIYKKNKKIFEQIIHIFFFFWKSLTWNNNCCTFMFIRFILTVIFHITSILCKKYENEIPWDI